MHSTRREFLERSALAAVAAGLGPGIAHLLADRQNSARPYLDIAIRCAQWIDKSAQDRSGGLAWPADPLKPEAIGLDFYNGMPGVVHFFGQLGSYTGDEKWRDRAQRGGDYLLAESERSLDRIGDGLYTGAAGLATTFAALQLLLAKPAWADAAKKITSRLAARAKTVGDGVEWSDSNDIVSGSAGIGLWLLQAGDWWKDGDAVSLAARAGRRLIAKAVPAEGGLMWFPAGQRGANYPNFSHGTAGVAYFLARLYERTQDKAFLDAAIAGERYLDAVATKRDGARAIFHVTGGGENRFYLSWCHGPAGTARLYYQLSRVGPEDQRQRYLSVIGELTKWVVDSGAPEQQSAGYWNNISQCCGNVGIGQYFIDLARQFPGKYPASAMQDRVAKNTRSRATEDGTGLKWTQAENRVSPENLVAQTGFMQGAAGVGTFFLQLDAFSRGEKWRAPLPDTPW